MAAKVSAQTMGLRFAVATIASSFLSKYACNSVVFASLFVFMNAWMCGTAAFRMR